MSALLPAEALCGRHVGRVVAFEGLSCTHVGRIVDVTHVPGAVKVLIVEPGERRFWGRLDPADRVLVHDGDRP